MTATVKTCVGTNVAVTDLAASIVTTQAIDPEQSPLQLWNTRSASGVAVSVTICPSSKVWLQVPGQSMPIGAEVTRPSPVTITVKAWVGTNVAVTDFAASMVTLQAIDPAQSPLQPSKRLDAVGVGVRVTCESFANPKVQVPGQSRPAGAETTRPAPSTVTVSACGSTTGSNAADTVLAASMVTTQSPAPVQAPAQAVNAWPDSGIADSVTAVP